MPPDPQNSLHISLMNSAYSKLLPPKLTPYPMANLTTLASKGNSYRIITLCNIDY